VMAHHRLEGVDAVQANARRAAGIAMPRQIRRHDEARRSFAIIAEQCHACGCTNAWAIDRDVVQRRVPRCDWCGTARQRIVASTGTTHL